jgi:hypothetical protein
VSGPGSSYRSAEQPLISILSSEDDLMEVDSDNQSLRDLMIVDLDDLEDHTPRSLRGKGDDVSEDIVSRSGAIMEIACSLSRADPWIRSWREP